MDEVQIKEPVAQLPAQKDSTLEGMVDFGFSVAAVVALSDFFKGMDK